MDKERLLELKEQQDQAKEEISSLKGQRKSVLQQLKDDWQCQSKEKAEEKIQELEKEKQDLQKKYNEGCEELETWLEENEIK